MAAVLLLEGPQWGDLGQLGVTIGALCTIQGDTLSTFGWVRPEPDIDSNESAGMQKSICRG